MLAEDAHLHRADPVMARLIDEGGPLPAQPRRRGRPEEPYGVLVRAITGQQLSVKAADSIWKRVVDRFGGTPTPEQILADDPEELRRAAGLSRSKAAFLRDLAQAVASGSLVLEELDGLPDAEVAERLIQVKGIGQWTVDMFLIFHLGRPDVLPVGDLGLRRASMLAYGLRKLPEPPRLVRLARPWRPWRSVATWYLWASLRVEPA